MPQTNEQIDTLLENLPDDVKEAVYSVETSRIILDIEKKYNLHVDQAGELANEALLLTVGATPPQKFIENIRVRMKIPPDVAKQIGAEVNEKIFRPIRKSLMQIHKIEEEAAAPEIPTNEGPSAGEMKNIAEEKLAGAFSIPKKTDIEKPDPYRETV